MLNAIFIAISLIAISQTYGESVFKNFITCSGDKLIDGRNELRFISFNIPNIHYVEDNLPFEESNDWRFPDAFEIADALESIRQMGGRVVRSYTLSVRNANDDPSLPKHVLGPGQFNEEAFRALDKVLEIANEKGIRVIIPFVDNWIWWGGRAEYAAFRGKGKDDFISYYLEPEVLGNLSYSYPETALDTTPHIGVDEAGKGDVFGPLCVAALYADTSQITSLIRMGIRDSKRLTDIAIIKIAEQIKRECSHAIIKILPSGSTSIS